ncbi:MAG: alpha-amylase family glycosyl hydrolase, partial [Pseudomonadota bacterium]|nr:alpha-amylase family glycosyl hydrolase [Pseudomonadota bacterium]
HIADLSATTASAGVQIERQVTRANPNYLWLDLRIDPATTAGQVMIDFSRAGKTVAHLPYTLAARAPQSAARQGFGPADAIYLIVPDRFANGDPSNDSVPGLTDRLDRANPGGRHGGDIEGIRQHLDYIAAMGFTTVWPTPLLENNQPAYSYHGYAMTDLYQVDARFGSNASYRQLVAQGKTKGLGFVQDIVLNHIGSKHWWMKDLPTPDWLNSPGKLRITNHRRSTVQDAYASADDRTGFTDGWFSEGMPDLNQRNPLLATYLIQNSLWWVEYADLTGIRTDTYSYSDKDFLARWSARMLAEYPHLNMVGEEWNGNPLVVSYWQKGKVNRDGYVSSMPSLMDFPLSEALRAGLMEKDENENGLMRMYLTLAQDSVYPDPGNLVIFEGNHDMSRLISQLGDDRDLQRMALVYIATMRGIPQFLYGTEILAASAAKRDDGEVRSDFPGGWAGDRRNAFSGAGLSDAQASTQKFLRTLLNWRKHTAAVQHGKLMHYIPDNGTYVYFRYDGASKVMVVFNKNPKAVTLETARFHEMLTQKASGTDIFTGTTTSLANTLTLPARSVSVLEIHD